MAPSPLLALAASDPFSRAASICVLKPVACDWGIELEVLCLEVAELNVSAA